MYYNDVCKSQHKMAGEVVFLLTALCLIGLCTSEDAYEAGTSRNMAPDVTIPRVGAKYLIYSVNPGEGFNLRRDVHMRAAILVKILREKHESEEWTLVLPPWPHLYHWKSDLPQSDVPWSRFFDLASLNEFVPTMEFEDFLAESGGSIDEVIHLQPYREGWTVFEDKWREDECMGPLQYEKKGDEWKGRFFGYSESVFARNCRCISILGHASLLEDILRGKTMRNKQSFLVERFEELVHDEFGGKVYWDARRSMVYANDLREKGYEFMAKHLNYKPSRGKGRTPLLDGGGPYMAVHMRRADYTYVRSNDVPSIKGAAKQIQILLKRLKMEKVFVATDASHEERKQLQKLVPKVVYYEATDREKWQFGDGGVAVIDQWIAAHAKYFVGTHESTFSFRIREDRQLMELNRESTFNDLCGKKDNENDPDSCQKPSYWELVQ